MFTPFCSADINTISLTEKRALLSQLKAAIKNDVLLQKTTKVSIKQAKEIEKKMKIQLAIKAAEDKLAKLTAKLAG